MSRSSSIFQLFPSVVKKIPYFLKKEINYSEILLNLSVWHFVPNVLCNLKITLHKSRSRQTTSIYSQIQQHTLISVEFCDETTDSMLRRVYSSHNIGLYVHKRENFYLKIFKTKTHITYYPKYLNFQGLIRCRINTKLEPVNFATLLSIIASNHHHHHQRFCRRAGPSLQAQEPRLQFCRRQVFHRKLRNQGCSFTRD